MDYFAGITDMISKPPKTREEKHLVVESIKLQQLIKEKIWEMCYRVQQRLSEGYFFTLMKSGAFQYSYRLWVCLFFSTKKKQKQEKQKQPTTKAKHLFRLITPV